MIRKTLKSALANQSMKTNRKAITKKEPVSPERMMTMLGMPTISRIRKTLRRLLMGLSPEESSLASIRMMASLANSVG